MYTDTAYEMNYNEYMEYNETSESWSKIYDFGNGTKGVTYESNES